MLTSRRLLLKQIGFGIGGIGLAQSKFFTDPDTPNFINDPDTGNTPIILSSNENPYGPSSKARKVFAGNATISNRYNWNISSELISAIATKNNLRDENIVLGAGSTEILDLVAKLVSQGTGSYVIADPSYDYWTVTLDNLGFRKIKVSLTADKKIDLEGMLNAIGSDTKLVYICNPNNPTGTICEKEALVNFVTRVSKNVTILIDEAYTDYTTQQSLSNLVSGYPNLIIARTFSKIYGLAGARIGYALANKTIIDKLSLLQSNPNGSVSVLSRLAAIASLNDDKFVSECISLNQIARKYTIEELEKLNCACISSNTNFIYFSLANFRQDYFQLLKNNNIQGTRIYEESGKWTRITVGTLQEMRQFIKAIQ